ncbi:hypothetical protein LOD99_512 [Oopsacas minuta]|uniref:Uncharacterized protein n=1 Tax=Oopsacas minuta TaxID=111878 RepID=A0AAV7KCG1_9METZ|nr:hypothetical protein LOD99_512 [Oopsacas minuta]
MATKYAQEIPMNSFEQAEQLIHSTFGKIIRIATERRDQLLLQLFDMKQDYLRKENTRKTQVADLEKMIRQFNETSIQQSEIRLDSLLGQLEKLGSIQNTAEQQVYKNKTNPIRRIGKPGNKKGELNRPYGLALDGDIIYIADTNNKRIQIFSTEGKFIHEFGKGQLNTPYGIALNKEWVFISDFVLNAVLKFSRTNYKLIKSVKGVVSDPLGLTTDTNGELLVADCNNNRIAAFSPDLEYML